MSKIQVLTPNTSSHFIFKTQSDYYSLMGRRLSITRTEIKGQYAHSKKNQIVINIADSPTKAQE